MAEQNETGHSILSQRHHLTDNRGRQQKGQGMQAVEKDENTTSLNTPSESGISAELHEENKAGKGAGRAETGTGTDTGSEAGSGLGTEPSEETAAAASSGLETGTDLEPPSSASASASADSNPSPASDPAPSQQTAPDSDSGSPQPSDGTTATSNPKKKKRRKPSDILRRVLYVVAVLGMCVCLFGMLYPVLGNLVNSLQHHGAVSEYRGAAEQVDDTETERLLAEADRWNAELYSRSTVLANLPDSLEAEYQQILRLPVTDIMGYIEIPKIDIVLPIYHGTDDAVLNAGIGHLSGSSVPVGGENTHAVLTGHSGLPASKLFTDLDQVEVGDTFTITVLNRVMRYEVYDKEVLLPEQVKMTAEPGQDLCTLITCTPVGINTHRLLVHARRMAAEPVTPPDGSEPAAPEEPPSEEPESMQVIFLRTAVSIGLIVLLAVVFLVLLIRFISGKPARVKRRKKKKEKQGRKEE